MKTVKDYLDRLRQAEQVTACHIKNEDQEISGLTFCSKEAVPNGMFVCKGAAFRVDYLKEARALGCVCYISEKEYALEADMDFVIVRDIRTAMAILGEAFYRTEELKLRVTGITGTKGKTTTAFYLKAILDAWAGKCGKKETGLLSSVENFDGRERKASSLTTPEAIELHRHMRNCEDAGLSHMTMEVSSQALKYKRVRGMEFEVGVFLNIAEDHISPWEHEDFEDYFTSKLSIFKQTRTACVNLDSGERERILQAARLSERVITFGTTGAPDIWGHDIEMCQGRISFWVRCRDFHEKFYLRMRGLFNVENALGAITAAYAYGVPVECMKEGLASVQVKGRMEEFESKDKKLVTIVDYAHNRLSFEKLYDSVFQEYPGYQVVTVFGCPGNKALNRRRDLGLIAGLFSSAVYLTTDDPGTESAAQISKEVSHYVEMVGCPCTCIEDRALAIQQAIANAQERTVVLVLGKGDEGRQRFGSLVYECPTDGELVRQGLRWYDRKAMCQRAGRNG